MQPGSLKPGTYRPTLLKLAARHCPAAINFYRAGVETDRRVFGVGIAAHAVLQALTEAATSIGRTLTASEVEEISLFTCEGMLTSGRVFEGCADPPLPIDDVWAGRELALRWSELNPPEPVTLPEDFDLAEVGLAVDENWKPVEYGQSARLRLIADLISVAEIFDEESCLRRLRITDYKSAWPTDESELDTAQLRAQAVLAWIYYGKKVDVIVQEVVNLRTRQSFTRELHLAGDGAVQIRRWRDELAATMRSLDSGRDEAGNYKPTPGGGCIGCPYLRHCKAGMLWSEEAKIESPIEAALAFASMSARLADLKTSLQEMTADNPIELPDGSLVGTVAKVGREVADSAWRAVWERWKELGGDPETLIDALGLGVSNIESVAARTFKPRVEASARKQWINGLMKEKVTRSFGIHRRPA